MAVTTREQLKQYALRSESDQQLWTSRWYYIMKNNTSGKLYIGQTKRDINEYIGSGSYWINHCKSNGGHNKNNITVIQKWWIEDKELADLLLQEFLSKEGEYWQKENIKWANQVPEDTEDNPFFINGSYIAQLQNEERLASGTHNFLKCNRTETIKQTEYNTAKAIKHNQEMTATGKHPFQSQNLSQDFVERRDKRIKNLVFYQLENNCHPSTNEESKRKIGSKNKIKNKQKVEAGTHQYLGGFYAVNRTGETVKISSDLYKSQLGDKSSWEYVHPTSKEGKKRRGLFK